MPSRRAKPAEAAGDPTLVVGVGASAGGLQACRHLVAALGDGSGMSFILVQHLDPTHESMLVDLLADATPMTVLQATDRMPLQAGHVYVIPPGMALSVADGALHLSPPQARHGARLPFDFLLRSLAETYGPLAACVILSGTGADGSQGLRAIKAAHGLVIAQDPSEAAYDGMPRSAILTQAVDHVLPIAQIPQVLIQYQQHLDQRAAPDPAKPAPAPSFRSIIDLLRQKTAHDFTLYKQGTLQRRIERRMGMAGLQTSEIGRYIEMLHDSRPEMDALANDLLINVTSFFRDVRVFDYLASHVIPDLLRAHSSQNPVRMWVAGCSTGEETYSLAMLFSEAIAAERLHVKLQVFASDVDPDAVASAREGAYPETIAADVSAERLERFFVKEEGGFRIRPELRSCVVFTVQDLLTDPPFSRIDLVSCRNVLIYLRPDAQAKVMSAFHFALNLHGILLLGTSETVAGPAGRFEVISKAERVYRHIARSRPGELDFLTTSGDGMRLVARAGVAPPLARQTALAERCRRLVMECYAPAAILINRRNECVFSLGPTDRYLRVVQGHATHDLLSMVRQSLRPRLRALIDQANHENAPVSVAGGRIMHQGEPRWFSITAHPMRGEPNGEDMLLICFVDEIKRETVAASSNASPSEARRVAELERELEATRADLQDALRTIETVGEEQNTINEEALSANEEYQTTNEELLTSKEELQSLNEELTALNAQLQETLERQRTTSNDLQNILYSTDIATLFLDINLDIRFFTPSTRAIFSVIPSDIGRPLADLHSLAADTTLLSDARTILQTSQPIEREIEVAGADTASWYVRRLSPYRTSDNRIEGVVITFMNVTERKRAVTALQAAQIESEQANLAKSRFLAAASHDLRQPLQTLVLLQGLLAKKVEGVAAQRLVALLDPTLGAMSGMLNTLLDINQIDAGTVQAELSTFAIDDLLLRLRDEFSYLAQAQEIGLRLVRSGLFVHSDPRLLEQMLRNLLANALKYTTQGRVLLGCRRGRGMVRVQIWDTGIGIPQDQLTTIFDEYHQVSNAARDRNRGLGLGLSIVQRLGRLLGHQVHVASQVGRGSVFTIEIRLEPNQLAAARPPAEIAAPLPTGRVGTVLVIEDDPDLRELLEQLLVEEGHLVAAVPDAAAALEMVRRGGLRPDLILADFNLPGGSDGLALGAALRARLSDRVPIIILTGDISTDTLRKVAELGYAQLNKPVKPAELTRMIQSLLQPAESAPVSVATVADPAASPILYVVDDDRHVREALRRLLEEAGFAVDAYASCEAFLQFYQPLMAHPDREACLLVDAWLPGMPGLALLQALRDAGAQLPAIMITGDSDVPLAVQAMKAGAADFIEKPIRAEELLNSVVRALERSRDAGKRVAWHAEAAEHIAGLTLRQRQVMAMVLAGNPSKNIAADLGISQRTVENHRATIMKKTGARSLPALARLAVAAQE
jgi:two-component system CheB/CheR fusion protein